MGELKRRIGARAEAAGLTVNDEVVSRLAAYLELLAFWNRRINLTAFDVAAAGDEAIDRLVIEPASAAALVRGSDGRTLDIGSGGGSPAVPLMIVVPAIETVLVESRSRKGAFLREVVRSLGLRARVEVARAEALDPARVGAPFDLVTFRAVRADASIWGVVRRWLRSDGRVLWFGGVGHSIENMNWLRDSGHVGDVQALDRVV